MHRIILGWGVSLLLLTSVGFNVSRVAYAEDLTSASYQVLGPVMSSGGYGTSTNYTLFSSISEFAHDIGSSASLFTLNPGFVAYPFVSTPAVSATAGDSQVTLAWTASQGYIGWTVSGYDVGQSTTSGGPYSYSSAGVTPLTITGLANGTTYYFVINPKDAFGNRIATSTQKSATPTASATPSSTPSSGGGGGSVGTTITISGRAYPLSRVTVLKDGQIAIKTIAGPDAMFNISMTSLSTGVYTITVYSEDENGNRSTTFTFPVQVTLNATTDIGGVFLAPTISVDKSKVKRGDNIAIFGQSVPQSDITISVHSEQELFAKTTTDARGAYLYNLDTTLLDMGNHATKSKSAIGGEISSFGKTVSFAVGTENVGVVPSRTPQKGDVNGDNRINLIDFSIAAYWYKRTLPPPAVDLNGDGKVDLIDFSIMAFYWTG